MQWNIAVISLSENNLMTENWKIRSQLMVVTDVNTLFKSRVTELEKQDAKMEQYSR